MLLPNVSCLLLGSFRGIWRSVVLAAGFDNEFCFLKAHSARYKPSDENLRRLKLPSILRAFVQATSSIPEYTICLRQPFAGCTNSSCPTLVSRVLGVCTSFAGVGGQARSTFYGTSRIAFLYQESLKLQFVCPPLLFSTPPASSDTHAQQAEAASAAGMSTTLIQSCFCPVQTTLQVMVWRLARTMEVWNRDKGEKFELQVAHSPGGLPATPHYCFPPHLVSHVFTGYLGAWFLP